MASKIDFIKAKIEYHTNHKELKSNQSEEYKEWCRQLVLAELADWENTELISRGYLKHKANGISHRKLYPENPE